jgi:lipopolysaccharide biosynthesis glycosyltransferase
MTDGPGPRDTLVFLAADPGYAFPMLAAARSFRTASRCDDADVAMFAIDFSAAQLDALRACAAPMRVTVMPLQSSTFVPEAARGVRSADAGFQHLTTAALARLAIWRHIPAHYKQALYIDGDTWCTGDFRPLLGRRATPGVLHATPDPLNFFKRHVGHTGAATRAYLAGLGLPLEATYYSSGVLLGDRTAWREIGEAALAYFFAHAAQCRLFDQSALNGACNARLAPMSLKWNFTSQLRTWEMDAAIAPRLVHFAGAAKPWLAPTLPWPEFFAQYEALKGDAAWAPFLPARGASAAAPAPSPWWSAAKTNTLDRWRAIATRRAILRAEAFAPF